MNSRSAVSGYWQTTLWALAVFLLAMMVFYFQTVVSMVQIWWRSETFAHGFLIVPISLWLIWRKRAVLASEIPRFQPWFLLPLLIAGFMWLIANLVSVLVVQQLAFITILICGICALLGWSVSRHILFPLGFLFFMVPMGEELIPPMMDFTADSTVWLIQLSGIPVYKEGLYFSLPSGNWSVVEACSGIRYLIASLTLGTLYAYLTYQSLFKRLVFIGVSIVVPILANSLRAYLIVMIGHWSGMKYAVGVDHLIYGWLFFGVVIFVMFAIGNLFKDAPAEDHPDQIRVNSAPNTKPRRLATFVMLIPALIWPVVPSLLPRSEVIPQSFAFMSPDVPEGWSSRQSPNWHWQPLMGKAYASHTGFYQNDVSAVVGVFINHYIQQEQDSEMVTTLDKWITQNVSGWHLLETSKVSLQINDQSVKVDQARIKNREVELLVWRWYSIGEYSTSNPYMAKFLEALARFDSKITSARIYVVTPVVESLDQSSRNLQQFVGRLTPRVDLVQNSQ